MVSDIIIAALIAAVPTTIVAIFAILTYLDRQRHVKDLGTSGEIVEDVGRGNKNLLKIIAQLRRKAQADDETKRIIAEAKMQEEARREKAQQWKMVTGVGKLFLDAYRSGLLDEFFGEDEEEYDE